MRDVSKTAVVSGNEDNRERWHRSIYDICTYPLEEQFKNDGLLVKAALINTGLDENTIKSI